MKVPREKWKKIEKLRPLLGPLLAALGFQVAVVYLALSPGAGAEFDRAFFEMVRAAVWVSWGLIWVSLWRMPEECGDLKVMVVVFGFPVVLTVLSLVAAGW